MSRLSKKGWCRSACAEYLVARWRERAAGSLKANLGQQRAKGLRSFGRVQGHITDGLVSHLASRLHPGLL